MLKKFVKHYYHLFDEKLENGTVIVLIIAFLVAGVGNVANANNIDNNYLVKANITEFKNTNQFIEINGKTYKLID